MSDNLPALMEYSKALAVSDLLPKAYQGKPANVLVAMEYGRALGLEPMAAIQGVVVIQGKPTASAGLIAGLVRRAGHILRVTGTEKRAEAVIIRSDDPEYEFRSVWTIERAQQAGLVGKGGSWKTYPAAMLKARAITEVARDACSEILAGVQYTPEELGVDEEAAAAPKAMRRTTTVQREAVTSQVPAAEPAVVDEPPLEDVVDAEVVAEEPAPLAVVRDPEAATDVQVRLVNIGLRGIGIHDRAQKLAYVQEQVGRPVTSSKDLTKAEASRLIDHLNELNVGDEPELEVDE